MEKMFEAHLDVLTTLHKESADVLEALPPSALDWSPGPDINSITVLIYHLTGSQRYWLGDVALREPSNRDRAAEFAAHAVDAQVLMKRLDDSLEYARSVFERLTLSDLELERSEPPQGRTVSVAWAVLHALEHAAVHVGHIQITRQLWEQLQHN